MYDDPEKLPESRQILALGLPLGMAVGAAIGVSLGIALDDLVIGLAIGVGTGLSMAVAFGTARLAELKKKQDAAEARDASDEEES